MFCFVFHSDPDVPNVVQEISNQCSRPPTLVILGSSSSTRARLLNCILGKKLLPDNLPRGCRWVTILMEIFIKLKRYSCFFGDKNLKFTFCESRNICRKSKLNLIYRKNIIYARVISAKFLF